MGVFDKTIIPLALVGYEMIIANSALHASLAGSERSVSKLRKTKIKENCCIELKYFIKRAREIGTFYVAVVRRRLKSCRFANTNLLLFCRSLCCRRRRRRFANVF